MTKEEIEAAIASPEVQTTVIEVLKGKGLNIFTAEENAAFIDKERARIADEKTSEIYSRLDKDIAEASGLTKEGEEKTYAFVKRALNTHKTKAQELASEIEKVKAEIKDNGADPVLKAQLASLQKENEELKTGLSAKDQAIFEKEISIDLNKGLSAFTPKPGIDKDLLDLKIEKETNALIKSAKKTEAGQIIYNDANGNPILNDKREPASAAWIIADRLKAYQDTGHKQTGAGTTPDTGRDNKTLPENIKSQVELTRTLKKMGILSGTPEFTKLFNEYKASHPNLPFE